MLQTQKKRGNTVLSTNSVCVQTVDREPWKKNITQKENKKNQGQLLEFYFQK